AVLVGPDSDHKITSTRRASALVIQQMAAAVLDHVAENGAAMHTLATQTHDDSPVGRSIW
ncbi:hypothetical protein ACFXJ8_41390, partial [Nonomuraea sp. NPDC059194]|uniref:hypothetical protein n=1 Tax=Nonomuraea sp. NPDC059194 TaxID=3346764 RepID=UPI0036AAE2E2